MYIKVYDCIKYEPVDTSCIYEFDIFFILLDNKYRYEY